VAPGIGTGGDERETEIDRELWPDQRGASGGGKIAPHDSHRTGRDVDVYFFRQPGSQWNVAATQGDIDYERTWALLRCFVTDCDVDFVLIDRAVQAWLESHALRAGEPAVWVRLFHDGDGGATRRGNHAVVRHAPGHVAHMHVRFVSPEARRLGVELYERLAREGYIRSPRPALRGAKDAVRVPARRRPPSF
jgi:hypothetical protein